ncbi:uncharacterized protein PV09_02688 [Verruconis gallopava]|uniref:C2H2-type domain-containing protein n=1 Tax=Verruconis gallopava TaxID=253628 RepID=A0A0D1XTV9_9PEZI|nr:uncharacterized protein PV09_02688 [Verruconis gallopava]KIW06211.1 hypothetical protein PV09_02688 [Verruconis gallopava]
MAPRARISGGESLDSPMRVTYEDSSASENEDLSSGARPTLKQVLKKPSRLLMRRSSVSKMSNPPSTPSRSLSSAAGAAGGREVRSRGSLKFAPSLDRLHHRPRSEDEFDVYGHESPLMETQQMTEALPDLTQPMPKRILPRANLEAIMSKPLPATPQRQETVQMAHSSTSSGSAMAALQLISGSPDVAPSVQKRKSSGELADGDARSLPKTRSDVVSEATSKREPTRLTRSAFKETAVMQWMDGVDQDPQRTPERNSIVDSSEDPAKPSNHANVVLSMLDQNRDNIARTAAKLCSSSEMQHPPPVPVPERDASARHTRKRDSSMTATSFTPSVFSRASSWTEHTYLTTPSEMVANNVRDKRTSRDSRDSWRYTRSFASPRSSVMSYSSIPFRTRPFKADEYGPGPDDMPSSGQADMDQANKDQPGEAESRFRDSASISRSSFPASERLSIHLPPPLSLSPVEENPEIRVTAAMDADESAHRRVLSDATDLSDMKDEKASLSANTMDMKGTIASTIESMDAASRQLGRFRGAFSPGMPTEIFGYHTLDFSASNRLQEETPQHTATNLAETSEDAEDKAQVKSLEHRRSISSDVLSGDQTNQNFRPHSEANVDRTIRQEARVSNSTSTSEASLSPTDSEFGEGSSGITDYTDDDIYQLSDAPGIGRVLQIALANIRRDVVKLVVQELNGISSHAHESNAYTNHAGGQLPSQGGPSNGESSGGQWAGNNGGNKRQARDRGNDEQDDREEGDPGKRRKLNNGAIHSSILRSRFACPFYKRNPDNHQRWRSCRGPGWEEVRRVKEHVYRRHMLFTCPRCLQHFEEKSLLDGHAQSDVPCTKATTPPPQDIEGCSQEQERKLRCRKRPPGETDEDRWAEMYRILFGDDCEVPGPYYDFDLPTTSPSPSDLPLIEDTFRQLPQRLAADISRRLRRPLDDEERDALPEIIRTSLQAVMPPFWRMFASTPGSDARAAPPASEQGDSAYGSAEHDRESSAPPRGYPGAQTSQTNFTQLQTPNQTPNQQQAPNISYNPPPSRDFSFTQNVEPNYNSSTWPQSSQSFVAIPQIPGTTTYSQPYHHAPAPVSQPNFTSAPTHADPPVEEDFSDLLVPPNPYLPESGQQQKESSLRWSIPVSIPGASAADLPALPIDTIPFSMPTSVSQHTPAATMNFQNGISPTTTMGPSTNFHQYINAPQMMHPYQQVPTSMPYHESNSGAVRTPNRQSINLLNTTDQIDNWMFSLNSSAAGQVQDVFAGTVGHHMGSMVPVGVRDGKKRRPEVGY